ncbi:MAG: thermonuclease family protein [Candidatus Omnitrophica bacterium]|nr:thermonuclease family protein [Candidatus Omnitrophota bacterium]MBU1997171.1 thermonuclease family protein [Candidatus Omnitrophota bacterium]MBU4334782.1 thermonuclease family protein [Candidatus Omnitrophota bacterium]
MTRAVVTSKYDKLITDVGIIFEGARKAMVTAYWHIGKRIVEIEQDGEVRAKYGANLINSLSKDLTQKYGSGFSRESLIKMRSFYNKFPKGSAPTLLNWTKYRELLSVKDDHKRITLEKKAARENISSRDLRRIVKESAGKPAAKILPVAEPELLDRPTNLILNTYKLSDDPQNKVPAGYISLDCGFYVDLCVPAKMKPHLTEKPSFAYCAKVKRVVDGDTLLVEIDLGFNARTRTRLRLRGINTPELSTPEGASAKRFVTRSLPKGKSIIVKSYSTDIFGRFVADVLYMKEDSTPSKIIENGIFLNNQLLEKGIAVNL